MKMRGLIWILACGGCLGVASATPGPTASPVCLYASRAYSEGAFVCLQKSLMLTCTADGSRMSWKVVADKDINDRRTAPTVQQTSPEPRGRPHWHHYVMRWSHPPAENPAKCFVFNGMQYCE